MNTDRHTHKHTEVATLLSDRLRSAGYGLEQDREHFGRSGSMYRIDVTAEHGIPLATTTLLAWCKDSDIEKRDVEEWIKEWNDLGYGKMIIATTAGILPKAVKMADMYDIRWFDGNDLKRWNEDGMYDYGHATYLKFPMSDDKAKSYAKKNAGKRPRKWRFIPQKPNVNVKEALPFYHPCYEATITYMTNDAAGLLRKRPVKRRIRRKVTVDARNGRLLIFGKQRIMYGSGIDPSEMRILRAAGKTVTEETQKKSGLTMESAEQAMRRLEERGIITTIRRNPLECRVNEPFPKKPKSVTECDFRPVKSPSKTVVRATVLPATVTETLRELGGSVERIDLVHIPYYRVRRNVDGTNNVMFINAVTRKRVQDKEMIKSMQDGLPDGDGNGEATA